MKKIIKDYDIFDDVKPFDIKEHIRLHVTTEERDKLDINFLKNYSDEQIRISSNYQQIVVPTHYTTFFPIIYNITTQSPQYYNKDLNIFGIKDCWCNIDYKTISLGECEKDKNYLSNNGRIDPYRQFCQKIEAKKEILERAQKEKLGEFKYLWKENSTQTDIEYELAKKDFTGIDDFTQTDLLGIERNTSLDYYGQ